MKIFITGASGFIGQRIIKLLLHSCADVNLLAITRNQETGSRRQTDTRLRWVHADITKVHETRSLLETFRPDICLHLAWYAEPGKYLTSQKNLLMMQSSLELIQIAGAVGCNRFIAAGTCAEYANQSHPLREDDCTAPSTTRFTKFCPKWSNPNVHVKRDEGSISKNRSIGINRGATRTQALVFFD